MKGGVHLPTDIIESHLNNRISDQITQVYIHDTASKLGNHIVDNDLQRLKYLKTKYQCFRCSYHASDDTKWRIKIMRCSG